MLTEQKNKTAKMFQFTATTSNPWDEVQFNFWLLEAQSNEYGVKRYQAGTQ